jgi:hypothetical protein
VKSGTIASSNLSSKLLKLKKCGGEGGIRTHGGRKPTPVFETGALIHYATSPQRKIKVKRQKVKVKRKRMANFFLKNL